MLLFLSTVVLRDVWFTYMSQLFRRQIVIFRNLFIVIGVFWLL